jgi:hypothetical protein
MASALGEISVLLRCKDFEFFYDFQKSATKIILRKSGLLSTRSLATKPRDITRDLVECLAIMQRLEGASRGIHSNCIFQFGSNAHFYCLVISVQREDSPKILQFLLFSAVMFLPLYIDTNHNDVGVMLILICNAQCIQLFGMYYFRALCAVTEGVSAKKPFRMTKIC